MPENDIMSAYETEFGVTLHRLIKVEGEEASIDVRTYEPDDEDFIWALEQLRTFRDDEAGTA